MYITCIYSTYFCMLYDIMIVLVIMQKLEWKCYYDCVMSNSMIIGKDVTLDMMAIALTPICVVEDDNKFIYNATFFPAVSVLGQFYLYLFHVHDSM